MFDIHVAVIHRNKIHIKAEASTGDLKADEFVSETRGYSNNSFQNDDIELKENLHDQRNLLQYLTDRSGAFFFFYSILPTYGFRDRIYTKLIFRSVPYSFLIVFTFYS